MDNQKVCKERDESSRLFNGDSVYNKLILLRNCIDDMTSDANSIRGFISSVSNEIVVADEKIKAMLEGNQKRIELLKDLNQKLAVADYKKSCYVEEFMDLVPLAMIKDYYNKLDLSNIKQLHVTNN